MGGVLLIDPHFIIDLLQMPFTLKRISGAFRFGKPSYDVLQSNGHMFIVAG